MAQLSPCIVNLGLDWKKNVAVDKTLFRSSDIDVSYGNSKKAKAKLGWTYDLDFKDLIKLLVDEEIVHQNYLKKTK